jgi:hypothetical protein
METDVSGAYCSYIQVGIVINVTELFLFSRLVAAIRAKLKSIAYLNIRCAKSLDSVQTITTSISNAA